MIIILNQKTLHIVEGLNPVKSLVAYIFASCAFDTQQKMLLGRDPNHVHSVVTYGHMGSISLMLSLTFLSRPHLPIHHNSNVNANESSGQHRYVLMLKSCSLAILQLKISADGPQHLLSFLGAATTLKLGVPC